MKYLDAYTQIHRQNPRYGSGPCAELFAKMKTELRGLNPRRAIDWGCGNSKVLPILFPNAECTLYDPAIPALSAEPAGFYDVGICTDVMEHIPDEEIDATFQRQAEMCGDWLYIIDNKVALQHLPDGTNAHVSQHPVEWWVKRMRPFFPNLRTWPCDSTRFFVRAQA